MLPLKPCFMPYRNSMANFKEQSREESWQEEEQAADKMKVPYDIFGLLEDKCKIKPLPEVFD